ncbi:MAG: hypothetical protein MNPFHGCM_00528 [Gemmatimonadaceae bacterium]|nr:hypothetical protein [Gemmatimonadaceae bacterium]
MGAVRAPGGSSPLIGLAWRESRTTRRRLFLYMSSISLGVAALVGIDSFANNIKASVEEQARSLVGGDVTFSSRRGWKPATDSLFAALMASGTPISRVTTFGSMALVDRTQMTRLAQVRAIDERFPLYGEVVTSPAGAWQRLHAGRNAVVDPALLIALSAHVGDSVSLGYARFEIVGSIDAVPGDPGVSSVIGPRIFIPDRYVDSTRLLGFGSRAEYDAFAKVRTQAPDDFVESIKPVLERDSVRVRTVQERQTNITSDIDDLSSYLGIVGVVALLLGGIGVASGVSAWVRRKIDVVAVLRCLGATSRQVLLIYATQAALMGLLGAVVGTILGVGMQFALPIAARDFLPVDVQVRLDAGAILTGLSLGVWISLAFALRPLLALRRVSPLQAIRRDEGLSSLGRTLKDPARVAVNALLAASVVGVSATRSESPREVLGFSLAIAAVIALLALSAATLSRLARWAARTRLPYLMRQGIANLHRPANQTRSVVLSLGFGAFLMTTLYLVQANLLRQFAAVQEASRGNLVLFDVQDDQIAGIDSIVRASGSEVLERTPIVTMRIAAINGTPTSALLADSTRRFDSWPLRREYRSSFRGDLTPSEHLVAGTWFGASPPPAGTTVFELSLEEEIARDLGVQLGDTVDWNVQGVIVSTVITSLRAVNWARFETNFFALFQPGALEQAPKMWVALVRTAGDSAIGQLQRDAVVRYPNVASVDLTLIRRTIADISNRASLAIRFLAVFSLAMGIPVLFSAVAATRRERVREGVLLKVLGATRRQIGRVLLSEYFALGVLGSLAGMLLAFGGAYAVMHWIFKRPFDPAAGSAAVIAVVTLLLTVSIGVLSGRDVFHETPMGALREV